MAAPSSKLPPDVEGQVVALAAAGQTGPQIAQALGCSRMTVSRILRRADNARLLVELRAEIKAAAIRDHKALTPKLYDLLRQKLANPATDPRHIDAITRAIHAMEKTAASLSGENLSTARQNDATLRVILEWEHRPGTLYRSVRVPRVDGGFVEVLQPESVPPEPQMLQAAPQEPACAAFRAIGEPCSLHSRPEDADG
jgi:DNA-binding CsgD family transcriptional regulator